MLVMAFIIRSCITPNTCALLVLDSITLNVINKDILLGTSCHYNCMTEKNSTYEMFSYVVIKNVDIAVEAISACLNDELPV